MNVAFLGLGTMGAAMAANLARGGFDVIGWNRTAGRAPELADLGVAIASSPAEAVASADVAVICVRIELSLARSDTWDGEVEQRAKLVGRAIAASIRLEDIGTRSDRFEFCVATPSTGLSGVLRFAARLRSPADLETV